MVELPSSHLIRKEHDRLVDGWTEEVSILPLYGKAGVIQDREKCLDAYIRLNYQSQTDLRAGIRNIVQHGSFWCWISYLPK